MQSNVPAQKQVQVYFSNIVWHTLTGAHSKYATGSEDALRYSKGFSPIVGFADTARPNFQALTSFCGRDEHFYCVDWTGSPPPNWQIEGETVMFKMTWNQSLPEEEAAPAAIPLGPAHAKQALELTSLTRPGPFGERTIELGEYFGQFDKGRLIAMAGERMQAGIMREISGVCVHPDYQGQGLARQLVYKLLQRETRRGEMPFLHVSRENAGAYALYESMGFRVAHESVVRVISQK
ncbi:GNAT family N-acetyltransferase [Rhodoferax sp. GW822-FHT02A01]|uniref:GNAT family N-acetyltransferase n=1 Tax=Rhodoferax sp. GW822-FHT02A01 TaxID=3141537 RepID=UPI00315CBECA